MLYKGTLPNMYKGVVRIGYPYMNSMMVTCLMCDDLQRQMGAMWELLNFNLLSSHCDGYAAPSSTPKNQVPSPDYWKGKCWEDIDLTESLRHHGKSSCLQEKGRQPRAGTLSKLLLTLRLWSHHLTRFNSTHPWRLVIEYYN